jgi:predicted NAD-dependent protein-ADP-ribosyltransferase YbiA (DUF1768 family)/phosphoribosyl-AMP cyclohydrolase
MEEAQKQTLPLSASTAVQEPDWSRATNFVDTEDAGRLPILPTVIQDSDGQLLSLVWSSERSLKLALERQQGIYESRRRGLWIKSPSGVNAQRLLSVAVDCDGDALLFRVAQRGDACHLERQSCFAEIWTDNRPAFRIGVCASPRGQSEAMELLSRVGFHVYAEQRARSTEFLVKSHLHNNVRVILCKPRDLCSLLEAGMLDLAVGFSDSFLDTSDPDHLVSGFPESALGDGATPRAPAPVSGAVEIVLFGRPGVAAADAETSTVVSEYDIENWDSWKSWSSSAPATYSSQRFFKVTRVHGNAEAFVAQGLADFGVAIRESGATLRANNLEVVAVLQQVRLGLFWTERAMRAEPRLFRSIRNDLNTEVIYFYSVDGPHGFMSNFYPCQVGDDCGSSEHFYQASKFLDPALQQLIKAQPTAKQCYRVAWQHSADFRTDWDQPCRRPEARAIAKSIRRAQAARAPDGAQTSAPKEQLLTKDWYMWCALELKFSGPVLAKKLIRTGDKLLVEHAMRDAHFGCGADGTGKNMLGKLLMELRRRLRDTLSNRE